VAGSFTLGGGSSQQGKGQGASQSDARVGEV